MQSNGSVRRRSPIPTYKIDGLGLDKPRVVEAPNPASARQHVATGLNVRKIEVSEAFALANDGVKLEKAGEAQPEFAEVEESS
ncbi:MAG: hypothetical protein ACREBK_03045 [Sphingomicrobium sp.]